MSNGTMNDPMKCDWRIAQLAFKLISYSSSIGPGVAESYIKSDASGKRWGVVFIFVEGTMHFLFRDKYKLSPIAAVRDFWQDCDGDGWLKKHLDSAKAKINASLDKVGEKLFPNVKPAQDLVPEVSKMVQSAVAVHLMESNFNPESYGRSAEAIADRATNFETVAKGAAWAVASTVVAAASAALYIFGMRNLPTMQPSPAGFGVTTSHSPFSSDQNHIM